MKPKLKIIYIWIIISVIVQSSILLYIDQFYLNRENESTFSKSIDVTDADTIIKVDTDAQSIKLSFDATYLSYVSNKKLVIIEVKSRLTVKTIDVGVNKINCYEWLPDRNTIIYSVQLDEAARISTYDVAHRAEKSYPEISIDSKETFQVADIDLSPLTNVVYVKINVGNISRIYKYNIREDLKFIMLTDPSTTIEETIYTDNLIYQDNSGKIFVRDDSQSITTELKSKEKLVLLGLNAKDMLFAGKLDSQGSVSEVIYGKPQDTNIDKSWSKIPLNQPMPADDIFIRSNGSIYQKDKDVLYINDNFVVTKDGKSVKIKTLDR